MKNLIKDLKIRTKIFIIVSLGIISLVLVVGIGINSISIIGKDLKNVVEENIPLLETLNNITFNILEQEIHLERAIGLGESMAHDMAAKEKFEIQRKNFLKHGQIIEQEIEKNRTLLERMYEEYKTHRIKDIIQKIDYSLRNIYKEHAEYQFSSERIFNLLSQGKLKVAASEMQKIIRENEGEGEYFEKRTESVEYLALKIHNFITYSTDHAERSKQHAMVSMVLVSFFILFISISLGIYISRSITKPLYMAVDVANQIAKGERRPDIQVLSKDEVGMMMSALKNMSENLSKSDSEVSKKTKQLESELTERKAAEEEKEKLQRQLIQSEKMTSLGEIAAGIAHELNTPLNVILGYQELIKRKIDAGSPCQEYVNIAIEEVEQCRQLIKDFMTYARPSSHEDLLTQSFNLAEVLKSSLKLLALHTIQNIKVHLDIEEDILPVQGSQKQVMQVFMNLINNAVQAMPDGGEVSVSVRHMKSENPRYNGERVEFRVCDNGIGITEEDMHKVFDPFFTTKRPGKGTGLGLAICLRIMENHKGTIRIESKPGKGTTVIGELPAVQMEQLSWGSVKKA